MTLTFCSECGLCPNHCNCPQELFDNGASFRDADWWGPIAICCDECERLKSILLTFTNEATE